MPVKALFLDRDGVINRELGHCVTQIQDFEILEDNLPFFYSFYQKGYILIVITNQSCLGLEKLNLKTLSLMHEKMNTVFSEYKMPITNIFFCPHHPSKSHCLCRKPNSLLFEKAIQKYNIDIEQSFMIGDKERDIVASEKVGVKGVLIEKNDSLNNYSHLFI